MRPMVCGKVLKGVFAYEDRRLHIDADGFDRQATVPDTSGTVACADTVGV